MLKQINKEDNSKLFGELRAGAGEFKKYTIVTENLENVGWGRVLKYTLSSEYENFSVLEDFSIVVEKEAKLHTYHIRKPDEDNSNSETSK